MEAGAVFDAGGSRNVDLVKKQLDARPGACRTRLRPRLAAAATPAARAAHGNVERNGGAFDRFAWRNLDCRRQRFRVLFRDEGAAHAFNGRRDRREIDRDLVGKPSPIVTRLLAATHRDRMPAETTERVPGHSTAVTIGAARREVNGPKRMSVVR